MTLFEAVESNDPAKLKAALEQATDVNELGAEKKTPLIVAAATGWLEGVQLLLAAGAEPEWRDSIDETAMLKAAANGHLEVARALSATASEGDRALGNSFLKAFGSTTGPDVTFDEKSFGRKAVEVAARAANFVGHEEPLQRLERLERAETNQKKR